MLPNKGSLLNRLERIMKKKIQKNLKPVYSKSRIQPGLALKLTRAGSKVDLETAKNALTEIKKVHNNQSTAMVNYSKEIAELEQNPEKLQETLKKLKRPQLANIIEKILY